MQSKPFEFRFRLFVHLAIILLGFNPVWDFWRPIDRPGQDTWSWLIGRVATHGVDFQTASILFLGLGIFLTLITALLRVWSSAYLNASIVKDVALHGSSLVVAGPYRFLRNPLYLAIILHTVALALLMPPTGALFAVIFITLFELRLIALEERFLSANLGQVYLDYKARVPRLFPALEPKMPVSDAKPMWLMGVLAEVYFWGVALTFAVLGWRYNSHLLTKGVLVSFGASLVVRALVPKPADSAAADRATGV